MKIAVVGWCEQGRSACRYWDPDVNEIVVHSLVRPHDLPPRVGHVGGPDYLHNLALGGYDKVIRVPIVHPKEIKLPDSEVDRITTATDEFLGRCRTSQVIGVTGTKGKSTTSTLIQKLISATGASVRTGGNNGTSPLDLLHPGITPEEWVVLELANFQLIDLCLSVPNMVLLPVDLDHLDWHRSEQEYLDAKFRPFTMQGATDRAFLHVSHRLNRELERISSRKVFFPGPTAAHIHNGWILFGDHRLMPLDRLAIPGSHNLVNVCAAVTTVVTLLGWQPEFAEVLESFAGCSHRLEEIPGDPELTWIDDSAATTPTSAAAALQSISKPSVVILGGSDKLLSWVPLVEAMVRAHSWRGLRGAVTVGTVAFELAQTLQVELPGLPILPITPPRRMDAAVEAARSLAWPGDCVLLSPGFASLDQYESYEHRSAEFRNAAGRSD